MCQVLAKMLIFEPVDELSDAKKSFLYSLIKTDSPSAKKIIPFSFSYLKLVLIITKFTKIEMINFITRAP